MAGRKAGSSPREICDPCLQVRKDSQLHERQPVTARLKPRPRPNARPGKSDKTCHRMPGHQHGRAGPALLPPLPAAAGIAMPSSVWLGMNARNCSSRASRFVSPELFRRRSGGRELPISFQMQALVHLFRRYGNNLVYKQPTSKMPDAETKKHTILGLSGYMLGCKRYPRGQRRFGHAGLVNSSG